MTEHRPSSAPVPPPAATLGESGLAATSLGLGLAALGRPAYITLGHDEDLGADRRVESVQRRSHQVLDAAYDAGIRYFDAARSYGHAEAFLASWLDERRLAPGDVTVGSKWGYRYVGDWRLDAEVHEIKDHSVGALQRQLAESRHHLGEHLRLYQIHSATPESGVLTDRAVLSRLVELGEEGVVVGLSVSGPSQADTVRSALAVEVDGVNPFRCVQATWNALERSAGPALAEAHAAGWGVIVKEVLANGRLTSKSDATDLAALGDIADMKRATVDAVAIAYASAQAWADVVLSGAATAPQLHSNLVAFTVELDPDDLRRLAELVQPPDRYWTSRSDLPWS